MKLNEAIELRNELQSMGYEALLLDHYHVNGHTISAVRTDAKPDVDIDGIPLAELYSQTAFGCDTIYY